MFLFTTKFEITCVGHICGLNSIPMGQSQFSYFKKKRGREMCISFLYHLHCTKYSVLFLFCWGLGCLPTLTRLSSVLGYMISGYRSYGCSAVCLIFGLFTILLYHLHQRLLMHNVNLRRSSFKLLLQITSCL